MGYEHNSMVARKLFEIIEYHENFISVFIFFFLIQTPQNSWMLKNVRVIIPLYSLLKLFNKIKKKCLQIPVLVKQLSVNVLI